MIKKIKKFLTEIYNYKVSLDDIRMSKADVEIISKLNDCNIPVEEIADVLEKTSARINYEIKQLNNLKEIK